MQMNCCSLYQTQHNQLQKKVSTITMESGVHARIRNRILSTLTNPDITFNWTYIHTSAPTILAPLTKQSSARAYVTRCLFFYNPPWVSTVVLKMSISRTLNGHDLSQLFQKEPIKIDSYFKMKRKWGFLIGSAL